jgi:hypothetical protein
VSRLDMRFCKTATFSFILNAATRQKRVRRKGREEEGNDMQM